MINFNVPYIWQTMPDSLTITPRQNVRFQNGLKNFKVIKFKIGRLLAIINYNMPDIWQTEVDSYPNHFYKINCAISGRDIA